MAPPMLCSRIQARAAAALILAAATGWVGCSRSPASQGQPAKRGDIVYPVAVVQLTPRTLEYSVRAVGGVEAFEQVQVTARVGGAVERVSFKEGDSVKRGQLLAEIEVQRYQLAVTSAQAALARAQANRAEAERELARATNLHAEGVGTSADVGSWQTKLLTHQAEVAQAEAALGVARLNLRDARVTAPIAGTIETRSVQTGQYVQPGSTLATLIRRDPLLLRFQVPEGDAAQLRAGQKAVFHVQGDRQRRYEATLTHIGGAANEKSRMVPIVAEVLGNPSDLRPGAFAEVTVPLGEATATLAVPETAIRASERGFLGFVVDEGAAKERRLELGLRTTEGLVQVKSGLRPGELLVVRGGEALKEGAKVRVTERDGKAAATAPPAPGPSAAAGAR